jgi:transcriptional regulator with XRE-family HTH domain
MWKSTGKAPKQELLIKIADFFGVTTDYLLGYDLQSQIDSLSYRIAQLKEELCTVSGTRKEEIEGALAVLEESYEDLLLAQSLTTNSENGQKKSPSDELQLTEGEKAFIKLLRRVPIEDQPIVIENILAALDNQG